MFFWYQKIFKKLKIEAFVSILLIFYFFGCKQTRINTKVKQKMYFSVKRLILNVWETFSKVLKGYFYFVVVSSGRKPFLLLSRFNKQDKSKNGLQRSLDSLETKRKRCYHGLIIFSFFSMNYEAWTFTISKKKNDF